MQSIGGICAGTQRSHLRTLFWSERDCRDVEHHGFYAGDLSWRRWRPSCLVHGAGPRPIGGPCADRLRAGPCAAKSAPTERPLAVDLESYRRGRQAVRRALGGLVECFQQLQACVRDKLAQGSMTISGALPRHLLSRLRDTQLPPRFQPSLVQEQLKSRRSE